MSRWSLEGRLLAFFAAVSATAAGIVLAALFDSTAEQTTGKEFQSLTGGLGFGCQTDLSWGVRAFDPRLAAGPADGLPVELGQFDPGQSFTLLAAPADRDDGE